jgi:hypothetical protein
MLSSVVRCGALLCRDFCGDLGAPIHFHNHALVWKLHILFPHAAASFCLFMALFLKNMLFYGRKRWFMWPPRLAMYSKKHANQWLREDYPVINGTDSAVHTCLALFIGHSLIFLCDKSSAAIGVYSGRR